MNSKDVMKLAGLFEDLICMRVEIDEFEDIMPKVSDLLYNRYCKVEVYPKNKDIPEIGENS